MLKGPQEAKAKEDEPASGRAVTPKGTPDAPRYAFPTAAADHPVGSAVSIYRVLAGMFAVSILRIYVIAPLPYVAQHVV